MSKVHVYTTSRQTKQRILRWRQQTWLLINKETGKAKVEKQEAPHTSLVDFYSRFLFHLPSNTHFKSFPYLHKPCQQRVSTRVPSTLQACEKNDFQFSSVRFCIMLLECHTTLVQLTWSQKLFENTGQTSGIFLLNLGLKIEKFT